MWHFRGLGVKTQYTRDLRPCLAVECTKGIAVEYVRLSLCKTFRTISQKKKIPAVVTKFGSRDEGITVIDSVSDRDSPWRGWFWVRKVMFAELYKSGWM